MIEQAVAVLRIVRTLAFIAVAFAVFRRWRKTGGDPAAWAAASVGALAVGFLLARFALLDPEDEAPAWLLKPAAVLILAYPYLLFRFSSSLAPASRWLERFTASLTAVTILATLALPTIPLRGEPRPAWFWGYVGVVLLQLGAVSGVVSARLWRSGRGQPAVARRRMHLLGAAALLLTIAAVFGATPGREATAASLVFQLLAIGSVALFYVALAPPPVLREWWRRREEETARAAVGELMAATAPEEVAASILPHVTRLVGGRVAVLVDEAGRVLGSYPEGEDVPAVVAAGGQPESREGETGQELVRADLRRGSLVVWASPFTPFFGEEEIGLVRSLGGLTDIALDRCRLLARERQFIADAAHELRTPAATISGYAELLGTHGQRMRKEQFERSLEEIGRQGGRLRLLVEELLDLSRIAVGELGPALRPVRLAGAVKQAVEAAPPPPGTSVGLDIPHHLAARAEPVRLEQVFTNLLTNAYRYGGPAIRVEGTETADAVRVAVSDNGPGVPPELVPTLFEPFSRGPNVERMEGWGLGLALVRRLVEALGGEILYEPLRPHGARFVLTLSKEVEGSRVSA